MTPTWWGEAPERQTHFREENSRFIGIGLVRPQPPPSRAQVVAISIGLQHRGIWWRTAGRGSARRAAQSIERPDAP
jgi:hypothetical protein